MYLLSYMQLAKIFSLDSLPGVLFCISVGHIYHPT